MCGLFTPTLSLVGATLRHVAIGGLILGLSGIRSAYTTGRGSIMMRSRHHVEEGLEIIKAEGRIAVALAR